MRPHTKHLSKTPKSDVRVTSNKYRRKTQCQFCKQLFSNPTYYLQKHRQSCKNKHTADRPLQLTQLSPIHEGEPHRSLDILHDDPMVNQTNQVIQEQQDDRIENIESRLQNLENAHNVRSSMIVEKSSLIWSQQSRSIVTQCFQIVEQSLIGNLVAVLYQQANPQTFTAADKVRIAEQMATHIKSLSLYGIVTSWKQKLNKTVQFKTQQLQQRKITESALRRYKIAAKFFEKFNQGQVCSQNTVILELIHESNYLRRACLDFLSLMIKIGIAPQHLRPYPKKLLIKGSKLKKKPISIEEVQKGVLRLLRDSNPILACDLWFSACLGLRKTELTKIYLLNQSQQKQIFDIVKVEERKNLNLTMRIIPSSLKMLAQITKTPYPITIERFQNVREYCLREYGSFYGLRHLCMTNIISSLLRKSNNNFHSSPVVTMKYYLDKEDYSIIDQIFTLNAEREQRYKNSGLELIMPLGKPPYVQKSSFAVDPITMSSIDSLINEYEQEENEQEAFLQAVREVGKHPLLDGYQFLDQTPEAIVQQLIGFQEIQLIQTIQTLSRNKSLLQVIASLLKITIYIYRFVEKEQTVIKYDPQAIDLEQLVQNSEDIRSLSSLSPLESSQLQVQKSLAVSSLMEQQSPDAHFLSVRTQDSQTCLGMIKQNVEAITSNISQPIRSKLRTKSQQYMHIKVRPPRCHQCKTLLFLSQCKEHRRCENLVSTCQCLRSLSKPCTPKIQTQYWENQPVIITDSAINQAQDYKVIFSSTKNNIKQEVMQSGKIFVSEFKWSKSLKQRVKIDLNVVNFGRKIQNVKEKQEFLPIRITQINEEKGKGVIATENLPASTLLCCFYGEIKPHPEQVTDDSTLKFGWMRDLELSIQCRSYSNVGRYFNSSEPGVASNCKIVKCLYPSHNINQFRLAFLIITTKSIRPGEELIFNYGKDYWQK